MSDARHTHALEPTVSLAPRSARAAAAGVALTALLAACSSGSAPAQKVSAKGSAAPAAGAAPAAPQTAAAGAPVRPLVTRVPPAVLVRTTAPLPGPVLTALLALSPPNGATAVRSGTVRVAGRPAAAMGVDPSAFRAFASKGTAEADGVGQAVGRGELVTSHALATSGHLVLGAQVALLPAAGTAGRTERLGALATTGLPKTDVLLDDAGAGALGLLPATGVLLSAPAGTDPVALAGKARELAGAGAEVDLLAAPAASPVAFLTGSRAAKAFGAFSYRYFPDGTIQPDAAWVRKNIVTTTVPVLGRVTCHRLMVPQLRGALHDVEAAGLGGTLHRFDGCYVPRFIESNPDRSISLHTWGIALDIDAAANGRGTAGHMDPRVVSIFKRWGFNWGGDWTYTDPMHFEMGAIRS
jgi:D-alanyl-D-alanine carboxypeptidase